MPISRSLTEPDQNTKADYFSQDDEAQVEVAPQTANGRRQTAEVLLPP